MKIKAAVLEEMGSPAPYAASKPLKVQDVELDGPGPGEVLIRIAAAGLCHSDLSVMNGDRPRPLPMVLGHEASAVVEEVGPYVEDLSKGDHVACVFVPSCGHCGPAARAGLSRCDDGRGRSQILGRAGTQKQHLLLRTHAGRGTQTDGHPEALGTHPILRTRLGTRRAIPATAQFPQPCRRPTARHHLGARTWRPSLAH